VQLTVEQEKNSHEEVLVGDVDVQIDCKGLVDAHCSKLIGSITLLHQLQENLILQLLRGRLTKGNHIFNESEDVVQLGLLANPHNDLKHLQRLIFIEIVHKSKRLVERAILRHQHVLVVLAKTDESGSLSKHPLEEIISIEVDDLIQQFLRSILNQEAAVLTIR
jgi:hypothetical protein